ncbi:MAG: phosphatidate cytidylyltransferase [Planctomycetaceae bacterium]|nr:phosphatidate cytidylyltransferase [Planctomycetaceae bacterium]
MDNLTICFLVGVLFLLILVSCVVRWLRRYEDYGVDPAILSSFRTRIRAWWILFGSIACVFMLGSFATVLLFFVISVSALREYITLTPKSPVDHQTLFWIYVFLTPLQFVLIGVNPVWFESVTGIVPYQLFSILLPGYVFLVLPGFMAISGDPKRFLERTAKLQLGLMICVYSLSYVPAILTMKMNIPIELETISELPSETVKSLVLPDYFTSVSGVNFRLLFFFVVVVQLGDVFQYLWSQLPLRHVVASKINSNRTWEGVLIGVISSGLLGVAIWYFTPFPQWWHAGLIAMIVSFIGFCGSMTMSAIKRDRGVSGYGTLIQGHNGILDRIDSLCFAAPVFYHLIWLFIR